MIGGFGVFFLNILSPNQITLYVIIWGMEGVEEHTLFSKRTPVYGTQLPPTSAPGILHPALTSHGTVLTYTNPNIYT